MLKSFKKLKVLFSEKYPEIHELELNYHKSIRDFLKDMIKLKNGFTSKLLSEIKRIDKSEKVEQL
jgi:hypothetical protein